MKVNELMSSTGPIGIPELPPAPPKIPTLLHCLFPLFRLLLLIPLVPILFYPRISFVPAAEARQAESGLLPQEDSSLLTPVDEDGLTSHGLNVANGNSAYGTFRTSARSLVPTTGTNTRSHTPAPSEGRDATAVS